jgi:hypothetical protein
MPIYTDIETAIRDLLSGLQTNGARLFTSVAGGAGDDWRKHLAALERLSAPAAMVALDGRARTSGDDGMPSPLRVHVFLMTRGLRSPDAARQGDVDTCGAWEIAEVVAAALDGVDLADGHRLAAVDEDILAADERQIVLVLRYLAQRGSTIAAPTLDGEAIAGADSVVTVQHQPCEARAATFVFPGIDGVFRQSTGAEPRALTWTGTLRAADHAALNAIEATLESLVRDGVARAMTDGYGREYLNCVAVSFARRGPRRVHPLSAAVVQGFELRFMQVGG